MLKCLAYHNPARGSFEGVPHQNIALVGGKPLLAWTIGAALKADCIGQVIVSTDDEQIAQVARDLNAEVPFLRPAELARDETPGIDPLSARGKVAYHPLNYLPEWVMLLPSASPLRTSDDIEEAFALARDRNADMIVRCISVSPSTFWIKEWDKMGQAFRLRRLKPIFRGEKLEPASCPPRPMGRSFLIRREVAPR